MAGGLSPEPVPGEARSDPGVLWAGDRGREEWVRTLLELRLIPGVGDLRARRLLERFGDPVGAMRAPPAEFERLSGRRGSAAQRGSTRGEAERILARCRDEGVSLLPWGDPVYPRRLAEEPDPPMILYLAGRDRGVRPRSVAVVGARRASAYGRRIARAMARDLAREGCTVVSGMALGIDSEAHQGALEGGGPTVAVLGCGLDRPYPAVHRRLYRDILDSGGAISELPPGTPVTPGNFPRRNRLIAGFSEGVVLVEGGRASGALQTAYFALDMGTDVMAVPGAVGQELSEAPFALLCEGGAPVDGAERVLEVLGWASGRSGGMGRPDPSPGGASPGERVGEGIGAGAPPEEDLSDEGRILEALRRGPGDGDAIARRTGIPTPRILAALGALEVRGGVRPLPGGRFEVRG